MDIILENIEKSYNKKRVFKDLNLKIKNKKINFIMGESGVGKTTLIKILLGIDKVYNGNIIGLENKRISCVFQEDRLCENLSIRTNLKLVNDKIKDKEIEDYLNILNINSKINNKVKDLSGGMKRRVAILRSLIYKFDVLILDEPFKGLDKENKERAVKLIKEKAEDKTVILISHDKREASFFNNVEYIYL